MSTEHELAGPFMNTNPIRFLRLPAVKQLTGLGKTALYKRIGEGSFPAPIKLGGTAVGWIEDEVYQWNHDRVAESRSTPSQGPSVVRPAARPGGPPNPATSSCAA